MKILIADKFEAWGVDALRADGFEVLDEAPLADAKLRDAVARTNCDVLIVRGTKVAADVIEASPRLGLIVRAGAGYNTIDVAAASRRGVLVANCPGKNAVAVAELTFALILALDRRVVDSATDLRAGKWNKKEYSKARGLKGRSLGIIGFGQIGRAVAARAQAFEMKVFAWSRSLTRVHAEECGVVHCATPAEVADNSDILSLHLAAAPETKKLVGADVLARLPEGAYVINTARADVLDYAALAEAVRTRGLRVGLDVYPDEPAAGQAEFAPDILKAGIVYGTHHVGASTDEAQSAIAAETVRIVREFGATGEAPNVVNIATRTPAKCQLVIRHYDRVGVLATILDKIRRANINVQEMSNTIFDGHHAAVAVIRLDEPPSDATVREIAEMKDLIIQVDVKPI